MDSKQIQKYKSRLEAKNIEYYQNQDYVKGKNPILRLPGKKKPDNRLPIPFAKMAVEYMTGYAGGYGEIKVSFVSSTTQNLINEINGINRTDLDDKELKTINDLYKLICDHNEDKVEISELYYNGNTQGVSYELWWVSDKLDLPKGMLTPEFKIVPNDQGFPIYSDGLKKELEAFLYFNRIEKENGYDEYVTIYYPGYAEEYKSENGTGKWVKTETVITYPYKRVPVAVFPTNKDQTPLFEAEKSLIDALDKILSSSQNEVDRFNALILMLPASVQKEFVDKLQEMNVMDDLGNFERWPEYLEKNLSQVNGFYQWLQETLERTFHKSIKIPDMADKEFAGDASGIAIAYKLLGMEFKAALIETYFNQGFQDRALLFKDIIDVSTFPFQTENYTINIDSKRNMPVDKAALIQIALQLSTLVSKKTVLKVLPEDIVEDVEAELQALEEEAKNNPMLIQDDDEDESEDEN